MMTGPVRELEIKRSEEEEPPVMVFEHEIALS